MRIAWSTSGQRLISNINGAILQPSEVGDVLHGGQLGGIVHLPSAGDAPSIPLVTFTAVDAVVAEPIGAIVGVPFGVVAPAAVVPMPASTPMRPRRRSSRCC